MPLSKCSFCDTPVKDKLCYRCHSASYCSEECQKSDFPLHTLFCAGLAAFRQSFPRPTDSDRLKYKLAFYFPFTGRPDFVWVPISIIGKNGEKMSTSVKIEEGHLTSPTTSHNFQSRESHFEVYRNDYPISKLPGPNKLMRALIRGYHHYLCNEVTQDVIRTNGPLVILKLNPRHPCRDGLVEKSGSDGLVKDMKQTGYKDITLADVRLVLEYYASKSKTFESDLPNRFIIRDPSKGWVEGVKISCEGDMKLLACKKYRDVWARPSTPEENDQALINMKMAHGFYPRRPRYRDGNIGQAGSDCIRKRRGPGDDDQR
ncbi:hypothetical protein LZ554_009013 [Drepanopeziza brunnea f. sp. 'monogermtubi']|nr:hypothetical protein LZ554_009013 [Drepanopeziza brunnea f. sp. 'monogermtubi']